MSQKQNQNPFSRLTKQQLIVVAVILLAAVLLRWYNNRSAPLEASGTPSVDAAITQPASGGADAMGARPAKTKTPTRTAQARSGTRTPTPTGTPKAQISVSPTWQLKPFDYYVLALSWSPDYCATSGYDDPQQCSIGKKLGFVLHGLWPQNNKGYPSNCSTEKMTAEVKAQFPNLYPSTSLYDHEWQKHGTCTGLSPAQYLGFSKQIKESVVIPDAFRAPQQPFRTTVNDMKTQFTQANPGFESSDFEVNCSGSGRFLTELDVCFSREGQPVSCGAEVHKSALKSCQAADFLVRNTR